VHSHAVAAYVPDEVGDLGGSRDDRHLGAARLGIAVAAARHPRGGRDDAQEDQGSSHRPRHNPPKPRSMRGKI
jgi:hypothetical protein